MSGYWKRSGVSADRVAQKPGSHKFLQWLSPVSAALPIRRESLDRLCYRDPFFPGTVCSMDLLSGTEARVYTWINNAEQFLCGNGLSRDKVSSMRGRVSRVFVRAGANTVDVQPSIWEPFEPARGFVHPAHHGLQVHQEVIDFVVRKVDSVVPKSAKAWRAFLHPVPYSGLFHVGVQLAP